MLTATFLITEPCCATRELQASHALTTIGRALDNSICLADDSNVSRYHAEIELRRDGFYLTDLGSSNGTTVNDAPLVGTRKLNDGDRILCGGTSLIEFFQLDSQSPHAQSQRAQTSRPAASDSHSSAHASAATDAGSAVAGSAMTAAAYNLRASAPTAQPFSASPSVSSGSSSNETMSANAETFDAQAHTQTAPTSAPAAGLSPKMIAAGVGGGVVLTACAALLLSGNLFSSGACRPSARIITPQTGTSIRIPTLVRVETENPQCIRRVRYQLNGREFAQSSISPFDVPLDPSQLPRAQSANSVLTVIVENKDGAQELQGGEIVIALGTNAKPTETTAVVTAPTPEPAATPALTSSGAVATADVQAMSQRLASQISRKSGYVFDREFAELIRARTTEYARAGATGGARRYRREITKAFRDRGLEPVLGFVLAFSVSKFGEGAGADAGLWRVPPAVAANFYAPGETAAVLADPKRASEIAAAYTKSLVDILEADNFTYAIACYGMPLDEAGEMSKRLAAADPAERRDFWKMVKSGVVRSEQVDRVTRFYAAGIVAENPSAFGASSVEQPFSSLY